MTVKSTIMSAVIGICILSAMPATADSIKIGFNAPLTGFAAADGKSALNGAELAVEQVNAAGGVNGDQLELVVYDDQASPKESVPIAQKLIEKDGVVAAVSGSYSGATRAAAGIFQESGVPYISAFAIHPISHARVTTCSALPLSARYRGAPAQNLSVTWARSVRSSSP